MLDFAVKLTNEPWTIEEPDRERLREAGFSDRDIWDKFRCDGRNGREAQPRAACELHARRWPLASQDFDEAAAVRSAGQA